MKKREDITIRFAKNGIIVIPKHPDYSRDSNSEMLDELVFNSVLEFEKWFEHHTGEGDDNDRWPQIDNGRVSAAKYMKHASDDFKDAMIYGMGIRKRIGPRCSSIEPYRVFVDPAKGGVDLEPIAMQEPSEEVVDALREAENVVKRFTGVK